MGLSATNTYSGGTTISGGGVVNFNSGGNFGAGPITLNGGGLQWATGTTTDISGQLAAVGSGGASFDTNGNAVTFGTGLSGSGGVTKLGAGTLTFSVANSYMGGTTVSGGTLALSGSGNLGANSNAVTVSGGTLDLGTFTIIQNAGVHLTGGTIQNGTLASSAGFDLQSGTVSAVLSGTGAVTKTTAGTVTLSGANVYHGNTTVSGGTLAIAGAGTLGATNSQTTVSGGILDLGGTTQTQSVLNLSGGTLQNGFLNAPISSRGGTINGIGGSASLTTSSGTTIVLGTNAYTGATTVNGGTLEVNGSITGTSSVAVNAGGTLTGTGLVDPLTVTFASGATFAPGTVGVPGTSMTITGNLVLQSGANYSVYVNPTTSSFAAVNGTATLTGAAATATFLPGNYVSKQYTILTATGGLGGTTFASLTNINLPTGASDSLSYDANDVFLNLTAGFTNYTGLNQNQQNVANALTGYFNANGGIPARFFNLTSGGLTQIDGENATDAEKGAFQLMNQFLGLMLDPFVDGRSGAGWPAGGGGAIGFAPEQPPTERIPSEIALARASALSAPPVEQRWSAWGTGFGGSNRTSGDPVVGSSDVTARDYGYAAGIDYHVSPDAVAGFALAGGGTNWGLAQGLGGGRSDTFQAGFYGVGRLGPAYIAADIAFADHWFTTNRTALGDQLSASFNGQSFGGRIETGYRFAFLPSPATQGGSAWGPAITPYAALQVQSFHTPSYAETDLTGGGFGLNYNAMNATDTRSELGARFDNAAMLGAMPLVLRARAAWAHDWITNPALGAVFEALPGAAFILNGAAPPTNSVLASAAAELHMTRNWSLAAKFDGEFASSAQTYAGTGTLRYAW